ncbi:hypothetical protein [Shewanella sp. MBTL60-007]|uniref:hypothetical protein n=1 Tax=Shewanella sp. MBTL60-007 TaxID=2815911 RepID=UPI001BC28C31|nr:hypothetical protein [Shewanella sp. MBTL60-007]GIU20810.1 hypothetical protein TUM3792_20840 [Shewanella sp. MBTL60-007]
MAALKMVPQLCWAYEQDFIAHDLGEDFLKQFRKGMSGFEDAIMDINNPYLDGQNCEYWIEWTEQDCLQFWLGFIDIHFKQLLKAKEQTRNEITGYLKSEHFQIVCQLVGIDPTELFLKYSENDDSQSVFNRAMAIIDETKAIWFAKEYSTRYRFNRNQPIAGLPSRIVKIVDDSDIEANMEILKSLISDLYILEQYDEYNEVLNNLAEVVGI